MLLVLALQACSLFWFIYIQELHFQKSVQTTIDSIELAMVQKNRELIVSTLVTSMNYWQANGVWLCLNQSLIIGFPSNSIACREGINKRYFLSESRIPGRDDYKLIIDRSISPEINFLVYSSVVILLFLFLVFIQWKMVFRDMEYEIIAPLSKGFTSDHVLAISELEDLRQTVVEQQRTQEELARAKAGQEIAKQVAHDIRSPLAALNMAIGMMNRLPEGEMQLVRNATRRINDIANSLLKKGKVPVDQCHVARADSDDNQVIILMDLLDSVISEKRVQYRDRMQINICSDLSAGYGLFSQLDQVEFSRVISNLINNSIEAFQNGGQVSVVLSDAPTRNLICIKDNGKGIPKYVLKALGREEISYGKSEMESGSGLGIFHAYRTIESAGGKVCIESEVGEGTAITLSLPKAKAPIWFVECLEFRPDQIVVSIDDEPTIHQVWKERLIAVGAKENKITHISFSSLVQFEAWFTQQKMIDQLNMRILIDYEFLGQKGNGLETIKQLKIKEQSILVSSRTQESGIQFAADEAGVKMLPKGMVPYVPMAVARPEKFVAQLEWSSFSRAYEKFD